MSVEYIKRRKTPTSRPEKDIVSASKNPQERKVGERNNPGAISYVPEELLVYGRPARESVKIYRTLNSIEHTKYFHQK